MRAVYRWTFSMTTERTSSSIHSGRRFCASGSPRTIVFWGQNDIFFTPVGGEAYLKHLPDAEMHRLDSGHFAVEDCLDRIAPNMCRFYDEKVALAPSVGALEEPSDGCGALEAAAPGRSGDGCRRGNLAPPWPYLMRHSYPCCAWRVRFGVLRQPTATHKTLLGKDVDENCPALLRLPQGGGAGSGGADELRGPAPAP